MVILRALEPNDVDLMFQVENEVSEWQHGDTVAPYSRHQLMEYALNYDSDPFRAGQLRLVAEVDGQPIGLLDLYEISEKNRNAFVGIYILPSCRRKGHGLDSLKKLCDYAFSSLGLHQLGAKVLETNAKALEIFKKAGFTESGILRAWHRTGLHYQNVILLQRGLKEG